MIKKYFETGAQDSGGGSSIAQKVAESGMVGTGDRTKKLDQIITEGPEEEEIRMVLAEMRRGADSLHKTAEALSHTSKGRAISLAITNFQEARQLIGCLLKERGSKSPYVLGNDSSTPALESHLWDPGEVYFDVALPFLSDEEWIVAVKKLREKSADLITDFTVYAEKNVARGFAEAAILPGAFMAIVKGRNWLGEVLGEKAKEQNAG